MAKPQVVQVLGTKQTLSVLRNFEPDFASEFRKELRDIGTEVQSRARRLVPFESPLSNWGTGGRVGWRSADIRAGIGVRVLPPRKRGSTEQSIVGITSSNPAGVIYERAGVRNYISQPRGRGEAFIKGIEQAGGESRMRIVGRAVNANRRNTQKKVEDVVRRANADLQEALDKAGRVNV